MNGEKPVSSHDLDVAEAYLDAVRDAFEYFSDYEIAPEQVGSSNWRVTLFLLEDPIEGLGFEPWEAAHEAVRRLFQRFEDGWEPVEN